MSLWSHFLAQPCFLKFAHQVVYQVFPLFSNNTTAKCAVLYCVAQKFQVTTWPKNQYGKFFNGDSYIILNVSNIFLMISLFSFVDIA